MTDFPRSDWHPTAEEYFAARTPDGGIFHGSSTLRSFRESPRLFGEGLEALQYRDAVRMWEAAKAGAQALLAKRCQADSVTPAAVAAMEMTKPIVSARHLRTLKRLESTAAQRFGSAVEHYLFPTSGEPQPDLPKAKLLEAEWRADDIRHHPVAGRWIRAEGAVYQVAHHWTDPASDLECRMRLDWAYWSERGPSDGDLKMIAQVNARNLRWKIGDAVDQETLYRRGKLDLWGIETPKTLIVADPSPGGKIFTIELSVKQIQAADDKLSWTLDRLAECYRTGNFDDPEEGYRVQGD